MQGQIERGKKVENLYEVKNITKKVPAKPFFTEGAHTPGVFRHI